MMKSWRVVLCLCAVAAAAHVRAGLPSEAGLVFHLDASALDGLTNGAPVAAWPDVSENGAGLIQPVTNSCPLYVTNAIGGRPAVSFDGNRSMTNTALSADWPRTAVSWFLVVKLATIEQGNNLLHALPNDDANRFLTHFPHGNGNTYWDFGNINGGGRVYASRNNMGTDPAIWHMRAGNGGMAMVKNGTVYVSKTSGSSTFNPTGKHLCLGTNFQGQVSEIIVYDRVLSATEERAVGQYLSEKYGIATAYAAPTVTPGNFAHRRRFEVTGYAGTETLENFPVLVTLAPGATFDYGDFAAPATGGDLRFALDGADEALSFDIDRWDTNGTSCVWVRLPALTNGAAFWAYWGNPGDTSLPAYATDGSAWLGSYAGVWHMNAANAADSTVNANHGTAGGTVGVTVSDAGRIGGCVDLPGSTGTGNRGYVSVPSSPSVEMGAIFSASLWVTYERGAINQWERLLSKKSPYGAANGWEIGHELNSDQKMFASGSAGSTATRPEMVDGWRNAQWEYLTFVYDGATIHAYANGVFKGDIPCTPVIDNAAMPFVMGNNATYAEYNWDGKIDEVRLADTARSADWIAAAFDTVAHADTFLTVEDAINALAASDVTSTSALLNGRLAWVAGTGTVSVAWGATDGGTDPFAWDHLEAVGGYTNATALVYGIEGLAPGTVYAYRFAISTQGGWVWSDSAVRFRTPPAGVTRPALWWDAAATDFSVPFGGAVAVVRDWSGNGNDATQIQEDRRPTLVANGIGGQPVLRFDGSSDGLYYDGNVMVGTDYTIFVVEHRRALKDNSYIFIGSYESANQNLHVGYRTYAQFTHAQYGNDYNMAVDLSGPPVPNLYMLTLNSAEAMGRRTYLNGEYLGGDASTAKLTAYRGASLGTWANQARYYDGDIAEVIMFDRALTPIEQNDVGRYLSEKYALKTSYASRTVDAEAFAYSADIAVTGYAGAEVLTNFPVLVKFGADDPAGFAYGQCVSPVGNDLRFTLKGETAALNHDVESWTNGGTSCAWVQVPSLTNGTTITAYWGNPALAAEPPYWAAHGAAWDDTFRGVWHLAETNFPYGDSTWFDGDGTLGSAPAASSGGGLIGAGQVFNGTGNKIDIPYGAARNPGVYSVSCWARVDGGAGAYRSPVTSRYGNPARGYAMYADTANTWAFWMGNGTGWMQAVGPAVIQGEWAHVTLVYDGTYMRTDVNGTRYGQTLAALTANATYPLRIGAGGTEGAGQYWFNGMIDEVRVCDTVRSTDWTTAEYANVAEYATFLTAGAVAGPGPSITNLPATLVMDTGAAANATLTDAALPATVRLYWGMADGGASAESWPNTNVLGAFSDGPVSGVLTGLTAATTYYYRFAASNALGTAWSQPAAAFTTKGAVFYAITPSAGPNGRIAPAGVEYVDAGDDSAVYTFVPEEGYSLTNVVIDGTTAIGAPASYQFTNVTAAHSIKALFGGNLYTITVAQISGGTIAPDPAAPVAHGADSEAFSITPAAGYYLVDVLVDGESVGARTSYQFASVSASHTLTARFAALPEGLRAGETAFWIQADTLALTNGADVTTWSDVSGNALDLAQPTWAWRPTFLTNGFNGRPAVSFGGIQSMTNATMSANWPTTNATIFMVAKADTLAQQSHPFRSNPFEANPRFSVHLPWNNGNDYFDYGNQNDGRLYWGNAGTDADSILCLENEAGVFQAAWQNGALKKSEATTGTWNPAGYRFEVGATYQGQIAELIVLNTALDELDRNRVGYYLAQKYGLDTDYVDPKSVDLGLTLTQNVLGATTPTPAGLAALQGGSVEYVITVANAGPTNAGGVMVSAAIPAGLIYQGHDGGDYDAGSGQWSIGELARNASTTLTVTVSIDTGVGYGVISNTAAITAVDELDRQAANDSASTALRVWYDDVSTDDYRHRVKITFPGYTRVETLTNFPALVTLGTHVAGFSYDDFNSALGADLHFTAADGRTTIAHEVETWNPDGLSAVWVRLPELQAGTYIWAYWGNDALVESATVPTDVGGCVLWLKGDAGVLTDGAGNVTNWLDQSGNGRSVAQANPARQPTRVAGIPEFGGQPGIRFADPDDDGVGLGPVNLGIGTNDDRTVLMVVKPSISATEGSEVIGADTGRMLDFGTWTQNHRLRVRNGDVNTFSGNNSVRYERAHILAVVGSRGNTLLNTWNGGEQMQIDEATTAFQWPMTALYVALSSNLPNRSFNGDLAELIVYDRALTEDELVRVGMYLSGKYGIKTSFSAPAYTRDGTVWSEGYTGAWHMGANAVIDSGPRDAFGRPNAPDPVPGLIGGALSFLGNEEVELGTRPSLSGTGPFALAAWIKTRAPSQQNIFQQRDVGSTEGQFSVMVTPAGYPRSWCYQGGYGFDVTATNRLVADGNWHHIVLTRAGTEGAIYVDGARAASHNPGGNVKSMNAAIPCGMGRDIRDDVNPFQGFIDEVRLSSVARSTNWIWAAFVNQASNTAFVGFETVTGAPVIGNRAPTGVSATAATLNGELLSTGALPTDVALYWGAADAGDDASSWDNTNGLGLAAEGPLAVPVAGLTAGSTVYYRFMASNAYATVWAAPSIGFTTPAAGQYAISPSASAGGAIVPGAVELVAAGGDSAVYTFTPDAGHSLTNVIVDGAPVGTPPSYQFTGVAADHSIRALFSVDTYTITVAQSAGGTITPDPAAVVTYGEDSEAFAFTPDAGHYVADVLLDGESLGARLGYTIANVVSNHTLTAVFGVSPALPVTNGLGFWVSADALGTTIDGRVGLWQDLSGNGRHAAQAIEVEQPGYTLEASALLNGKGAVRFDGVNDNLPFDGTFLAHTDYTVIVVEGRRDGGASRYFMAGSVPLAQNNLHVGYRTNTQLTHDHYGVTHNMNVPAYVIQHFNTWTFMLDSAGAGLRKVFWNGELLGTYGTITPLNSFEGATLGAAKAIPSYYNGDLAEVIIYARALSDSEMAQVGDYLSAKYSPPSPPPAGISGPSLWVAADAVAGLTNGATVSTWFDRSGGGRHLTRWTGSPRWIADGVNGKPVVRLNGTDTDYFVFPRLPAIRTVFWVGKEDTDATAGPRFLLGDTIGNTYDFHRADNKYLWSAAHAPLMFNGTTRLNGVAIDGRTTLAPTAMSILSVRTSGGARANALSFDRNIAGRTWDGDIAELIIYDRVLSDDEENELGAYLADKYNLETEYAMPGTLLFVR